MPAFESLQQQKNKQDAARRQSLSDQQVKGGIFSQFFHKYTSSSPPLSLLVRLPDVHTQPSSNLGRNSK